MIPHVKCSNAKRYLSAPSSDVHYEEIKDRIMAFGKYKGRHYSELPDDYLEWGMRTLLMPLKRYLQIEFSARKHRTTTKPKPERTNHHA